MTHASDLAWLAGFVDGEGSVLIGMERKTGILKPQITIGNTVRENIERAKRIVQAVTGREIRYVEVNASQGYRPCYSLRVKQLNDLRLLAEALEPLACGKRAQLRIMLRYVAASPGKGGRYAEEHYALRDELRQLNRRYPKGEWARSQLETEPPAPSQGEETARPLA